MNNSIYPCIWSNNNAREMADFYCGVFPETKISEENPVVVTLEIFGQKLMLLNGGDNFKPNPSISLMYLTTSPQEVESIYAELIDGGMALMPLGNYPFSEKYGWVEDKYGVSWQLYTGKAEDIIQTLVPTLMFVGENNGKASKAASFYTSLFPNSALRGAMHYGAESGEPETSVQHGEFLINNYLLMMMDSSIDHKFSFTEGVSLVVECDSQEEINRYWEELTSNGGKESQCGWLKDRFGMNWQIVPAQLAEWLKQSPKVMDEVLKMKKIDIEKLKGAIG